MPRVFASLACGHLIVLTAAGALGMVSGGQFRSLHVLLAVFALVLGALIQTVGFTYFVVTGKMMRQAVSLGGLATGPLLAASAAKRTMSAWLAAVVGTMLLAAGTGGYKLATETPTRWHLGAGALVLFGTAVVYYRQFAAITENARRMDEVMTAYADARHRTPAASPGPDAGRKGTLDTEPLR